MPESVRIFDLNSEGEGVATLASGKKIFIPYALIGEEVSISITEEHRNYARGKIEEYTTYSSDRVVPPCPLFGTCGGCHLMHLSYEEQLVMKQKKVAQALRRLAHLSIEVSPCHPSPFPLHYRNKIQTPVVGDCIGFYKQDSHELVDVPSCSIHHAQGNTIYHWLRSHIKERQGIKHFLLKSAIRNQESLVAVVTDGSRNHQTWAQQLLHDLPDVVGVVEMIQTQPSNTLCCSQIRTLVGRSYIIEVIDGLSFQIGPQSFFQVNPWQAEYLAKKAVTLGQVKSTDTVYDAFTGIGFFALFFARIASRVIGTERVTESIACAQLNAQLNQLSHCEFFVEEASSRFQADLTLLNPPRKGCDPALLRSLRSPRLLYVSCDPATLARDLSLLSSYKIETVQPIDLFPQTYHVETIVSLTKKKNTK